MFPIRRWLLPTGALEDIDMKKRLLHIQKAAEMSWEELLQICEEKLTPDMITGKGKLLWINDQGQEILEKALYINEIIPKHYKAKVIKPAPNHNYVFAYISEKTLKVPVLVPRKLRKSLPGKTCTIEEIEDVNGRSYRYVGA